MKTGMKFAKNSIPATVFAVSLAAAGTAAASGQVTLHQEFEIPPGDGTLFIQNGRIASVKELREFDLYCQLELDGPNVMPVSVPAGTFDIYRTAPVTDPQGIVGLSWQVADAADGGGPGFYFKGQEFYFQHSGEPRVWRVACVELIEAWDWREPTLEQMQAQLKGLISLQP